MTVLFSSHSCAKQAKDMLQCCIYVGPICWWLGRWGGKSCCDDVHSEFLINLIDMPLVPQVIVTLLAFWF